MLELSAERGEGAHPYFVPVEHTAVAREVLGDGPLLAPEQAVVLTSDPEQAVVLTSDPEQARSVARRFMATYLGLPNYTNNLRRLGWGDDDLSGPSEALVDAIVAWGDLDAIVARIRGHLDAGADHVAVQVLSTDPSALPMAEWRRLAEAVADL
jgi:hypothetical protein